MRKEWYRLKKVGVTDPFDFKTKGTFAVGSCLEGEVIERIKRAGHHVTDHLKLQVERESGCVISGEIDLVVDMGDGIHGVELKTFSRQYYSLKQVMGTAKIEDYSDIDRMTRSVHIEPTPKMEHVLQTAIYIWMLRQPNVVFPRYESDELIDRAKEIAYFSITYVNRDNPHFISEFYVTITSKGSIVYKHALKEQRHVACNIQNVLANYDVLWDYSEQDIVPPRSYEGLYSDERIQWMYEKGLLNKAEKAKYKKDGKVHKGDWQCRRTPTDNTGAYRYLYCPYGHLCEKEE